MNRRTKRDGNHKDFTGFLRNLRWWYLDTSRYPSFGADLLTVHRNGYPMMIEIKREGPPSARTLTDSEKQLQAAFPQFFRICQTVEELASAIGIG